MSDTGPRIPTTLVVLALEVLRSPGDVEAAKALAEQVLEASEQQR